MHVAKIFFKEYHSIIILLYWDIFDRHFYGISKRNTYRGFEPQQILQITQDTELHFRSSCSLDRTEILFDYRLCYMRMAVTSLGVTHSFRVHAYMPKRLYLSIISFEKVAWGNARIETLVLP